MIGKDRARNSSGRFDGLKIALVICTLDRPPSLARALDSVARAKPPRHAEWQVLVVDNSGRADAQNVAASFRGRLPIEMLVEPMAGLAHARNAAIARTHCDYFVWTDDDVTVGEEWIRAYEAAFERHPKAAFFGGPIEPRFEGKPPAWMMACLPHIYTAFAGRNLSGDAETLGLDSERLPFGANMAIRTLEQCRFRYDVTLGRQPGPLVLSGEETDVLRRICGAGGTGIWVPSAPVDHWIDRERQSIAYLRRYYKGLGLAHARAQLAESPDTAWGDALAAWCRLVQSNAAYLCGRMAGRPEVWIKALKNSAKLHGQLAAWREVRASGRAVPGARG